MNEQRRQLLQFTAIGLAAALLPACHGDMQPEEGVRDRFMQGISRLPGMDGKITPFSVYSGVALIVNIWASWCTPCRVEMPSLEKLGALFDPGDLRVIGVTVDTDLNLVREFLLRDRITFPLLHDPDNNILRVSIFPSTFLLRRDHTIARIIVGERDWIDAKMIAEIEALLAVQRLPAT